jgi:hypothetical protein
MALIGNKTRLAIVSIAALLLFAGVVRAATMPQQFTAGQKAKVKGTIVSRNGDLVTVKVSQERSRWLI